jgi:hypothetical protein
MQGVGIVLGMSWFSLKWRKGRFPLASKFRPLGGDFQGMRVYRSDVIWEERKEGRTAPYENIVSMSPPG